MPIEQIFETKEEAPEFLRPSLLEKDGKFVFQAELPHEIHGLKKALESERAAKKEYESKLKGFDGIDPEVARQMLAKQQELEAREAQSKGDWATREQQLKDQLAKDITKREQHYESEIKTREEKLQGMQRALDRYIIEAQATAAISAAKGTPELLMPHIARQVRIVEENGEYVARILDAQGQPRIADIKGTPFTIRHLVEEMKADPIYGRAFEASGAGGSGASNANRAGGNAKTISRASLEQMSPADQMAWFKQGGQITD
jgi:hypothetical protein